jgi:hypothetical protein
MNSEKKHIKMAEKFKMVTSQFSSKSFKILDLETSIHKKNGRNNLFSKLQNGGAIQDGTTSHCFILSALAQPFLNRF